MVAPPVVPLWLAWRPLPARALSPSPRAPGLQNPDQRRIELFRRLVLRPMPGVEAFELGAGVEVAQQRLAQIDMAERGGVVLAPDAGERRAELRQAAPQGVGQRNGAAVDAGAHRVLGLQMERERV